MATYRVTWAFGLRSYVYWPFGMLGVTEDGLHFDRRYSSGRPGIDVPRGSVEAISINRFWTLPAFKVYTTNRKRPIIVRPTPIPFVVERLLSDLRRCDYPVSEQWGLGLLAADRLRKRRAGKQPQPRV
jgi:hypothetical protein